MLAHFQVPSFDIGHADFRAEMAGSRPPSLYLSVMGLSLKGRASPLRDQRGPMHGCQFSAVTGANTIQKVPGNRHPAAGRIKGGTLLEGREPNKVPCSWRHRVR